MLLLFFGREKVAKGDDDGGVDLGFTVLLIGWIVTGSSRH
jgi:hypothetical protein